MFKLSNFTKALLPAVFLLLLAGCNDNSKTDAETAVSPASLTLTISKTTLNKDENTTVKVIAKYKGGVTKEVTDKAEWIVAPKDAVAVTGKTLTAKKDTLTALNAKLGTTLSNTVNLNIVWIINGHTLPPEPDKTVNDSTLLGVDVNDNGVRDDVERWIIIEEAKNPNFPKIWTAISLQYAWSRQKIIENPILESRKYLEDASACREYFIDKYTKDMSYKDYRKWRKSHTSILGIKKGDRLFNTKERIEQRFKFNEACSGHIFELPKARLDACQINSPV